MTNRHIDPKNSHTVRYSDGMSTLLLRVPWGLGTGRIPPPKITFVDSATKTEFVFLYDGEDDS